MKLWYEHFQKLYLLIFSSKDEILFCRGPCTTTTPTNGQQHMGDELSVGIPAGAAAL